MPEFRQGHSPAKEFAPGFRFLSSFTASTLALAMCLRTVVSPTRVLGRWNLRVAVDNRRQRLYRLRRERSAANTSSDLIALIAPVKNFEGPQSTPLTTRCAKPCTPLYLSKTARRPYLSVRPWGEGDREEVGSILGVALDFLVQS